ADMPHVVWQRSVRASNLPGIELWLAECTHHNIRQPLIFDVSQSQSPTGFDAVCSANTPHIMSWLVSRHMIQQVGEHLPSNVLFALYGPFNYQADYTSESNHQFDLYLKQVNPEQGIRDFEAVNETAESAGLQLLEDNAMPANNRLIIWRKV